MKLFIQRNMLSLTVRIVIVAVLVFSSTISQAQVQVTEVTDKVLPMPVQIQAANPNTPVSSLRPNHVAISVPHLQEAVRWYQEKLSFKVTKITEIPEISAQRAWLELNGFVMEIFSRPKSAHYNPPLRMIEEGMLAQGYFHVAFTVGDIDAVAAELHRRGVKFFFEPKTFNSDKRKVCFIKDNNGNPIELVQILK